MAARLSPSGPEIPDGLPGPPGPQGPPGADGPPGPPGEPPAPQPFTERIRLLSGRNTGGTVSATPEPSLQAIPLNLATFNYDVVPPVTPAGYTAILSSFSLQIGGLDTSGAPGQVEVFWMISAMPAPGPGVPGDPSQDILTSYFASLTASTLDELTTYSLADFTYQSDEELPMAIDPARAMCLYVQVDNQWVSPIWIYVLDLHWEFEAI